MYRAHLREIPFQTHTWCTGIFISYSIRDTVVCGEPTRYTATENKAVLRYILACFSELLCLRRL